MGLNDSPAEGQTLFWDLKVATPEIHSDPKAPQVTHSWIQQVFTFSHMVTLNLSLVQVYNGNESLIHVLLTVLRSLSHVFILKPL